MIDQIYQDTLNGLKDYLEYNNISDDLTELNIRRNDEGKSIQSRDGTRKNSKRDL